MKFRKSQVFVFMLISLVSCYTVNKNYRKYEKKFNLEEWELVWSDEFDYEGLPKNDFWNYEVGYIRNKEYQFYTNKRKENAYVKDGVLTIHAIEEEYANPYHNVENFDDIGITQRNKNLVNVKEAKCTSASINTLGKVEMLYGRIEVAAKFPKGRGVWPAIWMLGIDREEVWWPRCGEIDIMEYVGKEKDNVYSTIHFHNIDTPNRAKSAGFKTKSKTLAEEFHVYAFEWTEDEMIFLFDDIVHFKYDISKAEETAKKTFQKPYYLLLNLAIGGSWGGEVDSEIFPAEYKIDYVRYYKKK